MTKEEYKRIAKEIIPTIQDLHTDLLSAYVTVDKYEEKYGIAGLLGFVDYCNKAGKTSNYISFNVRHDIIGFLNESRCFLPRTTKYSQFYKAA